MSNLVQEHDFIPEFNPNSINPSNNIRKVFANYESFTAAQQDTLAFVIEQNSVIVKEIEEIEYPEITYSRFIPVSTSMWEWAKSITYFSEDRYGKARFSTADSDEMPLASITRAKGEISVNLAKIGYRYNIEEIQYCMKLGIPLESRRARAARLSAEELAEEVGFKGSDEIGSKGLINQANTTVTTVANANNARWSESTVTGLAILKQLTDQISAIMVDSKTILMPDTIILPNKAYNYIVSTPWSNTSDMTIFEYFNKANPFKAKTGQNMTIASNYWLDDIATGGRMVIYRRNPDVLEYHIPMPHRFLPVFRKGHLTYEVGGIMRIAGLDLKQPKAVRYVDNLMA